MGLMPPWSFSSLTKFETCPRQYYHTKVAKDVSDLPGEAALWGSKIHKHLEERVRDGVPLPESAEHLNGVVDRIMSKPGDKLVEHQMAVTASFRPAEWAGDETWCRGIADVLLLNGSNAMVLDWKTGKRKPESDQLKLFSVLVFANFPEVDRIRTGFLWLKDTKMDTEVFVRDEAPGIWNEFLPRVRRLELAYEKDKWPAKTSGLCKKWCSVGRSRCEFCGS